MYRMYVKEKLLEESKRVQENKENTKKEKENQEDENEEDEEANEEENNKKQDEEDDDKEDDTGDKNGQNQENDGNERNKIGKKKQTFDVVHENIVRKPMYTKISNSEFNYGFFKPKKDQCETCTAYKMMSPEEKVQNELTQNTHLEMKSEARRLINLDKEGALKDSKICCASYNLQKS
ncbi:myb-like protein X [Copidosoma floridanum]|uniref:myb-like protein X n=1 Tax=Copidosoma floridanum TaxID=29053 RepID=UPI0006C95723|nr:myb-like protein X [Copidosoma floridanum]